MLQRMTKLMEWVTVGLLGLILWISAYSGVALVNQFRTEILWSPVALVLILGVYSVLTIAYRCNQPVIVFSAYLFILSLHFQGWLHLMTAKMLQRSYRNKLGRLGNLIQSCDSIMLDPFNCLTSNIIFQGGPSQQGVRL